MGFKGTANYPRGFSVSIVDVDITTRRHYFRVIDDGGVIENYKRLEEAVRALQLLYQTNRLDTFLAAVIDPSVFGYKIGAGTGATAGRAAQKLYSLIGADSDVIQNTVASQPLLLMHNTTDGNYFFNPSNQNGNSLRTPDAAANDITGTIDIDAQINYQGDTVYFGDKRGATQQYTFFVFTGGVLRMTFFNGVSAETIDSTAMISNGVQYVRVKRDSTSGDVTFYTGSDGVSWTQLGAVVSSTAGALITQNNPLRIGSTGSGVGNGNLFCYSMRLYDGDRDAGGTLAANFIGSDYDVSVSQSTLTSSTTGEVWSVERSATTTGYKAKMVYRTTTQTDGIDDEMIAVSVSVNQPNTWYSVFDEMTWVAGRVLVDGGTAIPYAQTTATPNISANAGTALNFVGEALNSTKHYMIQFNDASSITGINGVYQAPASAGSANVDALGIGANAGASFSNATFNTVVIAKQADDLSTRNAMNTLVRSWNGNPA